MTYGVLLAAGFYLKGWFQGITLFVFPLILLLHKNWRKGPPVLLVAFGSGGLLALIGVSLTFIISAASIMETALPYEEFIPILAANAYFSYSANSHLKRASMLERE